MTRRAHPLGGFCGSVPSKDPTRETMRHQFVAGFADGAGLDPAEAGPQWDAFSRDMADQDRANEENQGWERGYFNGLLFAATYGGAA